MHALRQSQTQKHHRSAAARRYHRWARQLFDGLETRLLLSVTDTILHDFAGRPTDGSVPMDGLILVGSKLYGVSEFGGSHDDGSGGGPGLGHHGGVLFTENINGTGYQVLHEFGGTVLGVADGYEPLANLTSFNGKIYGTTPFGGPEGVGTIFSINPDGSGYQLIHAFGNPDSLHQFDLGADPQWAALVPFNNKLYGIATAGGRPVAQGNGDGVLFSIDGDGTNYTEVHVFDFEAVNPAPYDHGFVTDGTKFYGITAAGGPSNSGRVWSMNVDGSGFTVLHDFVPATDGHGTLGNITLVGNTILGLTADQGPLGGGTLFSMHADGTGFTVQHSFSTSLTAPEGVFPHSELLKVGNKLYASVTLGGDGFSFNLSPGGAIFSVNLDGTGYTNLYTFNLQVIGGKHDGATPYGALASDGTNLYGVTGGGGVNSIGTIFSLPLTGGGGVNNPPIMSVTLGNTTITSGQASPVDFGSTAKNTIPTLETFTITNSGSGTLTLGKPVVPAHYQLLIPPAASVAPGSSTSFTVDLMTTTTGTFAGNISFSNNSNGTTNTFKIPVTGVITGVAQGPADLTVSLGAPKPTQPILVPGDKVTLPVLVTNTATGAAVGSKLAPIVVEIRASSDNVFDSGDTLVATYTIPATIAGGKSLPHTVSFTLPAGLTTGNTFFVASVDTTHVITESNESNNTATTASPIDFEQEFGTIPGRKGNTSLSFNDADGTRVTLRLTGPGIGTLNGSDIALSGTTAKSTLTITTGKSKTPGDDGRFHLHNLTVGNASDPSDHTAIGTINASTTDLAAGGEIAIAGPLTTLFFGNVADQHTITIGAPATGSSAAPVASLSFANVTDTSLTSAIGIKFLRASNWTDSDPLAHPDVITAPSIGTLSIPGDKSGGGDFQAGLALTGGNGGNGNTLDNVTITGSTSGAPWNITGDVGLIKLTGRSETSLLQLNAHAMLGLTVAGTLTDSNITLTQGVDPKKFALEQLTGGTFIRTEIRTAGNINVVKAAVFDHTNLFAGVQPTVHTRPASPADFVDPTPANLPTIGSIVLLGPGGNTVAPAFIDSNVAAGSIGLVTLRSNGPAVSDPDNTGLFGFARRAGFGHYNGPASFGNYKSPVDALIS